MMKNKTYFYVCFLVVFFGILKLGFAQNPNRKFERYSRSGKVLIIQTNDGYYRIEPYRKTIVETSFIPKGETYTPHSYAVVLKPKATTFQLKNEDNALVFSSKGISVNIQKQPFQISYYYGGRELISEKQGYQKGDSLQSINFNVKQAEILMGGGARALGMNRRGNKLPLYNKADYSYGTHSELLNFTLPIVFSSQKYLLHFDNAPIGALDLDSQNNNTLTYKTIGGRKTYQIIAGKNWKSIVNSYTDLTGKQPMPPRWALGNFSSRFGYHSQKEVLQTVKKFKEDSIPVEAAILDLYWFGHTIKGTMGNLEFVRDSFPHPKKMIKTLRKEGVKTVLVTEPFILTTSKNWDKAVHQGVLAKDSLGNAATYDFYFGHTGLIDVFKPKAQHWFWNVYKRFIKMGVAGQWGDLGEPEVHPSWVRHVNGSADEVHNIFGNAWAKLIDDGYRKDFPNQRPFILMRAGYAGAQRFGMIPWSGDVHRGWDGLHSQPEISLQMGMQGIAFMHSDLGGFAGDTNDPELYERWLQYGVFQPIFRPHAQEEVASEPVFKTGSTKAIAKKAIELRYKLLPYNYTLVFQNHAKGWPLIRPLFFETPNDFKSYFKSTPYYWGHDFLISPVLAKGKKYQRLRFPKTANWFDFYTDKEYKGGTVHKIQLQRNHIPTFVRGGAFIPMANLVQTTDNYSVEELNLHFYADKAVSESEAMVYNDDGETPQAFEKGQYEILHLKSKRNADELIFTLSKEVGKHYKSTIKQLHFVVHNVKHAPRKTTFDGEKIKNKYDGTKKTIRFSVPLDKKKAVIMVELKNKRN